MGKTIFNPLHGSIPSAAALRRAVRWMKEAGQSPRDLRLPIGWKRRSNPGQHGGMRHASCAEVSSTEHLSPRLNLRRSTRVDAWNVMPYPRCVINAPVRGTVTYLSCLRNCDDSVSGLRHSQKSRDMGAGESVGVGTPTTGPAVFRGILKEWLWPSPTDWSL